MSDLAKLRERLFTSVLSDCLDAAGHRNQAMHARIRPLDDALVLCGRARTAAYVNVYDAPEGENPYELEIRLLDDLKPDEVPMFACGASGRIAPWGELLSTAARARGAAGVVMDGLTRDVRAIRAMLHRWSEPFARARQKLPHGSRRDMAVSAICRLYRRHATLTFPFIFEGLRAILENPSRIVPMERHLHRQQRGSARVARVSVAGQ